MAGVKKDRTMKLCRRCGFERPLSDFYRARAARYAGGYRYSSLCREHTKQQRAELGRSAPEGSRTREAIRKANRAYMRRRRAKEKSQTE